MESGAYIYNKIQNILFQDYFSAFRIQDPAPGYHKFIDAPNSDPAKILHANSKNSSVSIMLSHYEAIE